MPEPLRAAVYCTSEAERAAAQKALGRGGEVTTYDGVLEGWLDGDGVRELAAQGIVVDPLDTEAAPPEPRHDALERKTHCEESDPGVQALRATLGPQPPRVLEPEPAEAPDVAFYHIRLSGPITEEQRRAFVSYDVDLAAFEPPDAYRTRLTREQYGKVRATPGVRAVERYRLEETLTPELLAAIKRGPARRTFDCILHRIADRDRIVGELRALAGVKVLEASWLYIRFEAPADAALLAKVAYTSGVRRLDVYEQPSLMVARARSLVGADALPWTGKGELVAVFDSGIDREHPDLHDRVKSVEHLKDATADDLFGHGTHVAGIIAGTGAASGGKIKGVAPDAKLAIIGFVDADNRPLIPMNWADLLARAVKRGAHIINLSVGTNPRGLYDFGSLALDEFACANPDVLVVVAAGNSGVALEGWVGFHTVGSPATAKNALTVGASDTDRADIDRTWGKYSADNFPKPPIADQRMSGDPDFPAALSSRGPTDSDAVKPDVLAPGTYILSARASKATMAFWEPQQPGPYAYLGGTSMATPVVSGCAAVLRQYLREERKLKTPSAALLKAILIASARRIRARDLPGELRDQIGFPDYDQGFGRVDLTNVLPHAGAPAKRRLEYDDVRGDSPKALASRGSPGELAASNAYRVTVADGAKEPLRVVLTWSDWPSDGVQNNLHLKVTAPGGTPVYGNPEHWAAQREAQSLLQRTLPTGEQVPALDKRNNVEQIVFEKPAAGQWTVEVLAENTPKPPQGYAVCVVGELDSPLEPG
jgi:serine protease AprX